MLKFILQLAVLLAVFIASCYVLGWLMPILTNPIVFVVLVGFIALLAVKIAVRS
jgi:uncharacterized protein (DUF2062 family)